MHYFIISFQIIFPILFYMALGVLIRQARLIGEETFTQINRLVFRVFLPIKLFLEIYQSDFGKALQPKLILYGVLCVLIIYVLAWAVVCRFVKDRRDAPTLIQMIYRSNYVLFGLSIAENMYPDENLSLVSVLAAFVVPVFNILAVVLFEVFRGKEKLSIPHLLKGIIRNPLVLGSALGLLIKGADLEIPTLLQKPLTELGAIATPLAILCVGATLTVGSLKKYRRYLVWATLGRLVIVPGIFLGVFLALGLRGIELVGLFLICATPVASSSYPMAKELDGNGELAGLGVAVSNVACLFTLFLWITLLKFWALC